MYKGIGENILPTSFGESTFTLVKFYDDFYITKFKLFLLRVHSTLHDVDI